MKVFYIYLLCMSVPVFFLGLACVDVIDLALTPVGWPVREPSTITRIIAYGMPTMFFVLSAAMIIGGVFGLVRSEDKA